MEAYAPKKEEVIEGIKGTKTEQNLHTALSGESQAYLRYVWFSKKAETDGLVEISKVFQEIADNEKEHAEIWFRYLGGWSSTERNLDVAASGEHFEWSSMYSEFSKTAREEGLETIAQLFDRVAAIEKSHEERYASLRDSVRTGEVFSSQDAAQKWICINCGYVTTGKEPPRICPTCSHPQGYFKKQAKC